MVRLFPLKLDLTCLEKLGYVETDLLDFYYFRLPIPLLASRHR